MLQLGYHLLWVNFLVVRFFGLMLWQQIWKGRKRLSMYVIRCQTAWQHKSDRPEISTTSNEKFYTNKLYLLEFLTNACPANSFSEWTSNNTAWKSRSLAEGLSLGFFKRHLLIKSCKEKKWQMLLLHLSPSSSPLTLDAFFINWLWVQGKPWLFRQFSLSILWVCRDGPCFLKRQGMLIRVDVSKCGRLDLNGSWDGGRRTCSLTFRCGSSESSAFWILSGDMWCPVSPLPGISSAAIWNTKTNHFNTPTLLKKKKHFTLFSTEFLKHSTLLYFWGS